MREYRAAESASSYWNLAFGPSEVTPAIVQQREPRTDERSDVTHKTHETSHRRFPSTVSVIIAAYYHGWKLSRPEP
jgi:hypothetical protein